jgi:pyruvate carboxylase subunit B
MIVLAPMPGGALTANTMMMRDNNTLHLYPQVLEEMGEVVAKGGFGTSVTPVSQFYVQQAYINVVMGKWKKITDGYGQMVLGYFGKTPRPADPEIVKLASQQLKKEPFVGDPLEIIPPGIEPATKILKDNNLAVTDENIFIIAACESKGLEFLKGNAPLSVYYKEEVSASKQQEQANTPLQAQNLVVNVNGKDYHVQVRPDDGKPKSSGTVPAAKPEVKAEPKKETPTPPKPEPKEPPVAKPTTLSPSSGDLKAPLHGVVYKILVNEGDNVKVDQPLIIIEAKY